LPDRVRSLVYLDAFVPEDGKSLVAHLPRFREAAPGSGPVPRRWLEGFRPLPASVFAVNAADAAWVDRQCTPHPLSSFEAPPA